MRRIVCTDFEQPLALVEEDDPRPRSDQVLISVECAGLNYVDALMVRGLYQIKPPRPFTPGSEIAGTILALGSDVQGWQPGDRVFASPGFGGFADRAVISANNITRVPDNFTMAQAASFSQSYGTGYFALTYRITLRAGETMLVLGAAGGVGRAALDIGKALGARVIAAASSDERLEACRAAGADEVINYSKEDLKTRARELTDGRGVDVVYDPVGADLAEPALRALNNEGRYLVIGFARGPIPRLPINQILLRNRSVVGVEWGAWVSINPDKQAKLAAEVLTLASNGRLSPPEPVSVALTDVHTALDDFRERRIFGKAVIDFS